MAISRNSSSKNSGNISRRCANAGKKFWSDKSYIDNVLARGAKRANEIANQVMHRVRAATGITQPISKAIVGGPITE